MEKYNKKGISLIVLIITIIVMIILAAAIILSLSNSGIMDKANKAKTDSDTANLKEYVNVLEAEWELQAEGTESYSSKEAYVNGKLAGKYPNAALGADGEVYTGLNEAARKAIAGGIKIGDVVTGYTLDSTKTSYTTSGNENTASSSSEIGPTKQTVTRIEYAKWRYIGIGENGEVLIAPEMVSTSATDAQKIKLSGKGGYLNGPKELNDMCAAMYSVTGKGTARSMNIDDITRILDYTGPRGFYTGDVWDDATSDYNNETTMAPKKISEISTLSERETPDGSDIGNFYSDSFSIDRASSSILKSLNTGKEEDSNRKNALIEFVFTDNPYWLASNSVYAFLPGSHARFNVRYVSQSFVSNMALFISVDAAVQFSYVYRPVVQLNSDVSVSYGNGSLTLN